LEFPLQRDREDPLKRELQQFAVVFAFPAVFLGPAPTLYYRKNSVWLHHFVGRASQPVRTAWEGRLT
jgi:hypothetical protein